MIFDAPTIIFDASTIIFNASRRLLVRSVGLLRYEEDVERRLLEGVGSEYKKGLGCYYQCYFEVKTKRQILRFSRREMANIRSFEWS